MLCSSYYPTLGDIMSGFPFLVKLSLVSGFRWFRYDIKFPINFSAHRSSICWWSSPGSLIALVDFKGWHLNGIILPLFIHCNSLVKENFLSSNNWLSWNQFSPLTQAARTSSLGPLFQGTLPFKYLLQTETMDKGALLYQEQPTFVLSPSQ